MATTLSGNGFSYTFPDTFDVREYSADSAVALKEIIGRDGGVADTTTLKKDVVRLVLSGLMHNSSLASLQTAHESLMEILNSTPDTLTLTTFSDSTAREIKVRANSIAIRRQPPFILDINIGFLGEKGGWQTDSDTVSTLTLATAGSSDYPAYAAVNVDGDLRVHPVIDIAFSGTYCKDLRIFSYGRNLIRNSSFENDEDNWTISGTPRVSELDAYHKDKSAYVNSSNYYLQGSIPVGASKNYTASCYAKTTGATAKIEVNFYNDAAGTGSISGTLALNDTWQRVLATGASPANSNNATIKILTTGAAYALIDAVQLEETTSAGTYRADPFRQYAYYYNVDFAVGDKVTIDFDRMRSRWFDTSERTWTHKFPGTDGYVDKIEFKPGTNYLGIGDFMSSTKAVTVRYRERYSGF